jgi:hypothetical protein
MRYILMLCLMIPPFVRTYGQARAEQKILAILDRQTAAWNSGDVAQFMVGYWNSDSLMYIGKGGVTYGYAATLQSYRRNYSDTAQMGKLKFTILHLKKISPKAYLVVGKWHLTRSVGNIGGHYTLLFRKIRGEWVIVADHSS